MLSPTELKKRLKQATEAVEQAGVAEDLRPIAFQRSLDALGVGAVPVEATGTPQLEANARSDDDENGDVPRGRMLGKLAARLGVDQEAVDRIFDEEAGVVRLILKRGMLPEPGRKAASMRDVALLVVIGRQAAGIEEYTAYDSIREECRELKVYDGPNFATEVAKLEFRTRGGRNSKEAKANRHHYDDAADLVRRMTQVADS